MRFQDKQLWIPQLTYLEGLGFIPNPSSFDGQKGTFTATSHMSPRNRTRSKVSLESKRFPNKSPKI